MTLDAVVDLLACPACGGALARVGPALRCDRGHAFDVARQGYVNLLGTAPPAHADTTDMVEARRRFLAAGHYGAVVDAVAEAVPRGADAVLDCGAGPGHYLEHALGRARRGLAIDVSVPACRAAARVHPRLGAVVADTWGRLPVRDRAVDVVLSVFAPRHASEFARVLRPSGVLVVVTPGSEHLTELRAAYGLLGVPDDKQQRLAAGLDGFRSTHTTKLRWRTAWDRAAAEDVIAMGPNAFHTTAAAVAARSSELSWPQFVTVDVRVTRWTAQAGAN